MGKGSWFGGSFAGASPPASLPACLRCPLSDAAFLAWSELPSRVAEAAPASTRAPKVGDSESQIQVTSDGVADWAAATLPRPDKTECCLLIMAPKEGR